MTEQNIIVRVSNTTGYSKDVVKVILTEIFKEISDIVMKERSVSIKNFGTFTLKCLGRRVINHHYITGEQAIAPEHYKVTFMAYADLRRRAQRKRQRDLNKKAKLEQMEMERELEKEYEKETSQ